MKKIFIKFILVLSLAGGILTSCVDDSFEAPVETIETQTLTPTTTVALVNAAATGATPVAYTADDIIEAYVTSSDKKGTFYKSVSFQTIPTSGNPIGFSVPIDVNSLFAEGFTPGRKVYIKLKGLYIAKINGSMQIGLIFGNTIGRISPYQWRKHLIFSPEKVSESAMVRTMTMGPAYNDANLNTLIEIDMVQFTDGSIGRTYFDVDSGGGATNHMIAGAVPGGLENIIRFSSFATFAAHKVPSKSGKIRGVMTKFGSTYQFLVRYEEDIKLTSPRYVAQGTLPFNETFTTGWNNWSKISVIGAQSWILSAAGNPGSCGEINGFSGGAKENDDWLISPVFDFTGLSTATLTFDSSKPFSGNALEVYVSTNYLAGAPSTATWTRLTANVATSTAWLNSGNISLTPYVGKTNVRIAFRYTSNTTTASKWGVDNVKIN